MVQSAMKQDDERIEPTASQMTIALARYKDSLLSKIEHNVAGERLTELDRVISTIPVEDTSAEGQRAAFAKVKSLIEASAQQQIDTSLDFAIRETVRKNLDLPLFPRPITVSNETPVLEALPDQHQKARLLDVEVVAIYW